MILDEIVRRAQKRVEKLPTTFPEQNCCRHASLMDAILFNTAKEPGDCGDQMRITISRYHTAQR